MSGLPIEFAGPDPDPLVGVLQVLNQETSKAEELADDPYTSMAASQRASRLEKALRHASYQVYCAIAQKGEYEKEIKNTQG